MPTLHLTERAVTKLPAPHPDGKQTSYWDDDLRGFGVVCSGTTNQKHYIAQRDVNGKTRRVNLGATSGTKCESAREEAADVLGELRRGNDPKKKIECFTLRQALEGYLGPKDKQDEHPKLRPASVALYWQLERYLNSWLEKPLREITPDMVQRRHAELAEQIGKVTANLAVRVLRILWNYAADQEGSTLPAWPTRQLKRSWFNEKRRTRSIKFDELPDFYRAVGKLDHTIRDYIMLLLFTGMRRRETAQLRWTDIDFAKRTINLSEEVTKGKRALDMPMSSVVHAMLVARRQVIKSSQHVFPGVGKSGCITSPDFAFAAIAKATGIKVSAHDMRRTWSSVANNTPGVSWLALKVLMNHSTKGDVTAGYPQIPEEQLAQAAQQVCDRMLELCAARPVLADNVKPLRS